MHLNNKIEQMGLLETTIIIASKNGKIGRLSDNKMICIGTHMWPTYKNPFYDWRGPIIWKYIIRENQNAKTSC